MKITRIKGKCLCCEEETNIILDCGKYACVDCLHHVGRETNDIRRFLNTFSDVYDEPFMKRFTWLLDVMKRNNVTKIDNVLKTLEAIKYCNEYERDIIDEKTKENIERQLDIFDFL